MKRRDFIKNTAASSALLGIAGFSLSSFTSSDLKHITILHTNDVHSYIDPFPADHPRNANMGGVARRAALIESIRSLFYSETRASSFSAAIISFSRSFFSSSVRSPFACATRRSMS